MKLDSRFITHTTKGEHYMIPTSGASFNGIVKNNDTAAFIVECLKEDTSESVIVEKIMDEYTDAERACVEMDVAEIIRKLRSIGAIDD